MPMSRITSINNYSLGSCYFLGRAKSKSFSEQQTSGLPNNIIIQRDLFCLELPLEHNMDPTPTTPPSNSTPRIYGNDSLSNRIGKFQDALEKNAVKQKQNPFSGSFECASLRGKLGKYDPNYGKPVPGTKTEARGIKAHESIEDEIRVLCSVIEEHGKPIEDGLAEIKFGELFKLYQVISNKVVGVLIRARKHGFVQFEGEMLYQKRDDNVVIKLIKSPQRGIRVTKNQVFKLGQSLDSQYN